MTDEQIAEIYALARESFFGGQKSFQIQAYPFKMTPLNMANHRNSPHMAFWKMLKRATTISRSHGIEPKVDVCEKRYVFDAESSSKFSAADRCPAYKVPDDIVAAVSGQAAPRRYSDRRTDQSGDPDRADQNGRGRRHEPDFPGRREIPWRARRHHSYRDRHDSSACQPAG